MSDYYGLGVIVLPFKEFTPSFTRLIQSLDADTLVLILDDPEFEDPTTKKRVPVFQSEECFEFVQRQAQVLTDHVRDGANCGFHIITHSRHGVGMSSAEFDKITGDDYRKEHLGKSD